ncbi:MAG: hypothetical protein P4M09_14195 [Devosia sp.]|nr:hypothetical protein [Devosia sp.]
MNQRSLRLQLFFLGALIYPTWSHASEPEELSCTPDDPAVAMNGGELRRTNEIGPIPFKVDWTPAKIEPGPFGRTYTGATLTFQLTQISGNFTQSVKALDDATKFEESVSPSLFAAPAVGKSLLEKAIARLSLDGLYIGDDWDAAEFGDGSTVRLYDDRTLGGDRSIRMVATFFRPWGTSGDIISLFATCSFLSGTP